MASRTNEDVRELRLAQLNMRRAQCVTLEIARVMDEECIDILLMQEPYNPRGKFIGFGRRVLVVSGGKPGTAVMAGIAIRNPKITATKLTHLCDDHCVCVEVIGPFGRMYLASIYFQCSDSVGPYIRKIEEIASTLPGEKLIISADVNARSPLWHCSHADTRGEEIELALASLDLTVLNEPGSAPTFRSHSGASTIDITLASRGVLKLVRRWSVVEEWTTSDHNVILTSVAPQRGQQYQPPLPRYNTRTADWGRFRRRIEELRSGGRLNAEIHSAEGVSSAAIALRDTIIEACNYAMKPKKAHVKSVTWWTESLTKRKRRMYVARKAFQTERTPELREKRRTVYLNIRREYKTEIEKARRESWQRFVTEEGNRDPWGVIYKLCSRKVAPEAVVATPREWHAGDRKRPKWEECARALLDSLVPDDTPDITAAQTMKRRAAVEPPTTDDAPPFDKEEVRRAISKMKNGKAPGPDRIEVEVLKASHAIICRELRGLFNACLRYGIFPETWKEGSIRALLKDPDRDASDPASYRPICLLSVVGKCLEKLLAERLRPLFSDSRYAATNQFGFRTGKSTTDAILEMRKMVRESTEKYVLAILFDIKGAFDHVWWPSILHRLRERGCPRNLFLLIADYLRGRTVGLAGKHGTVKKNATRGCPQGSILGPSLWNLVFDDLLRTLGRKGVRAVAYADDLLIVIPGKSRALIENSGQSAIGIIEEWCEEEKLTLSAQKTEMLLLKGTLDPRRPPTIRLQGRQVRMRASVRYLGVHLDTGLRIKTHVRKIKARSIEKFNALAAIAKRDWGLEHTCMSTLYNGIFIPIATYAAASWCDRLDKSGLRILEQAQRLVLAKVTKAYRTVSAAALPIVAGVIPIDLLIKEQGIKYEIRKRTQSVQEGTPLELARYLPRDTKEAREALLAEWQRRWNESTKGRKTYSIFPDVEERLQYKWVSTNHYVTQFLTGHGDFAAKLAKLGIRRTATCACGEEEETADHVLLHCRRFEEERLQLRKKCQGNGATWPPEIRALCARDIYPLFKATAGKILRKKERNRTPHPTSNL